jgi:hypothetical protein
MKHKIAFSVAVGLLSLLPVTTVMAQQQGATRAEVMAELVQLEQAGYDWTENDPQYPTRLLQAEARIAAQQTAAGGMAPASP